MKLPGFLFSSGGGGSAVADPDTAIADAFLLEPDPADLPRRGDAYGDAPDTGTFGRNSGADGGGASGDVSFGSFGGSSAGAFGGTAVAAAAGAAATSPSSWGRETSPPSGSAAFRAPSASPASAQGAARDTSRGRRSFGAGRSLGSGSGSGFWSFATRLPWIGDKPFRKQLQVLVPALAVSLAVVAAILWFDSRQAGNAALLNQIIGDALTHSQRLAKAAPGAVSGNAEAMRQLRDSRAAMSASVAMLQGAPTLGGRSADAPSVIVPDIHRLDQMWKGTDAAAGKLAQHERLLASLGAMRKAVNDSNRALLDAAQVVAAHKLQSNAPAREVSAAGDLVMLTQKIAKDVNQLVLGESVNAEAAATLGADAVFFREITANLLSGNDRLRMAPTQDPASRRALEEIRRVMERIDEPLTLMARELPRIQEAKRAEFTIFSDSESLRTHLESIQGRLQADGAARSWTNWIAALFGLVALLSSVGLVQAYLNDTGSRAEEAERQRREAERLEQEAKLANDQNQAAILRLMNELQEVADGDLTIQATVSEDITGAIADSVNYTVEELRSLVSRINATAGQVEAASSKAQEIATGLQAASEQQSLEIRDTGEAVLEMAHRIDEMALRAAESAKVARQSLRASEGGAGAVENAITGMDGIRDQIQETAKRIKRLGESSQEIGEIVELISDITEQTNVLSLNAAIQAASAGEAGRGFTVVAEEVQRLAERSAEATRQIAALIRAIQTDTQDAVAAMERSTQGVVEGTRLSDEAGRALGEIGRVSTRLAELIEGFSATASKQSASAATVAQAIQRILLVTEQTGEGTLQTAGSIRQVSELAQELKSSVSRFKVA
ncbi:methyl-accepting chemotaxis protein [Quisquiliibacterium transsilvanicum]|uniref:Twitching motility protein PilJ n=1 Tax=Quisquiliibacterium transsilvanicum TaxID=1549638 RepID=A0A7W8HK03_9BURK|nr:methyl-accepting chemotaxis protein [Quisquiliibacterium transsilvanicum]MBB5273466.1 twitching motility protein PilJ [Quisquiliibacterium transsilvanicum]